MWKKNNKKKTNQRKPKTFKSTKIYGQVNRYAAFLESDRKQKQTHFLIVWYLNVWVSVDFVHHEKNNNNNNKLLTCCDFCNVLQ